MRLPLWKNCLDNMIAEGMEHGKAYPAEFFEKELCDKRDTMRFGLAISEIRRQLEKRGYYLSGRGQNGNSFIILPVENHKFVADSYQRAASDAINRAATLLVNTRMELLEDTERKILEKKMEKIAWKQAMLSRPGKIVKALGDKAQKLLQEKETISARNGADGLGVAGL